MDIVIEIILIIQMENLENTFYSFGKFENLVVRAFGYLFIEAE